MCKKLKGIHNRIDKCMSLFISLLNAAGIKTRACCCGHGKYPMSIIEELDGDYFEMFSGKEIKRKRNFYKKDKQGYYFIPETLEK